MPIINDEQAAAFLHSNRNFLRDLVEDVRNDASGVVMRPMKETNPIGKTKRIPDAVRSLIGATTKVVGPTAAAQEFGISVPTAHHIARGNSGHNHDKKDVSVKDGIENELKPIRTLALDRLKAAITHITEEKLMAEEPTKLASIAKQMSSIVKETLPDNDDRGGDEKYQFNIFAPQVKSESHYTVVEA